jgi:hypothetical protein
VQLDHVAEGVLHEDLLRLRADDMFQGRAKLDGEPPVRNQNETDI